MYNVVVVYSFYEHQKPKRKKGRISIVKYVRRNQQKITVYKESSPAARRGKMAKLSSQTTKMFYIFIVYLIAHSIYYIYNIKPKGETPTNFNETKLQRKCHKSKSTTPLLRKQNHNKILHTNNISVQICTSEKKNT